ncbi:MAG: hypothetical protein AB203_00950 [Parcubacteria bacterium C7867-008]|nr:MAG: hypothetical protein AB203_00950 [Parcubacteria bacterium C7867-008]
MEFIHAIGLSISGILLAVSGLFGIHTAPEPTAVIATTTPPIVVDKNVAIVPTKPVEIRSIPTEASKPIQVATTSQTTTKKPAESITWTQAYEYGKECRIKSLSFTYESNWTITIAESSTSPAVTGFYLKGDSEPATILGGTYRQEYLKRCGKSFGGFIE